MDRTGLTPLPHKKGKQRKTPEKFNQALGSLDHLSLWELFAIIIPNIVLTFMQAL